MNTDKTKINIKEETNSNLENNEITKIDDVNLSSKSSLDICRNESDGVSSTESIISASNLF